MTYSCITQGFGSVITTILMREPGSSSTFQNGSLTSGLETQQVRKSSSLAKSMMSMSSDQDEFARLADGDVDVGDRLHCLGHVHDVAGVLPNLAYALQRVDAILIHQAVAVRGGVQDVGAVGVVVRDDVLGHDLVNILQGRARELGLPEPGLLQRVAGHRRELVGLRGIFWPAPCS